MVVQTVLHKLEHFGISCTYKVRTIKIGKYAQLCALDSGKGRADAVTTELRRQRPAADSGV